MGCDRRRKAWILTIFALMLVFDWCLLAVLHEEGFPRVVVGVRP